MAKSRFFSVKLAFFLRHHLVAFQQGAFSYGTSGIRRKHEVKAGTEVILIADNYILFISVLKLLYLKYVLLQRCTVKSNLAIVYMNSNIITAKHAERSRTEKLDVKEMCT